MSCVFIGDLGYSNDFSCLNGRKIVEVRTAIDENSLLQAVVMEFADGSKVQLATRDCLLSQGMAAAWWKE